MVPLKIAVIGSGISGLSSAWLLSQRHDVTLFEADARLGGHSNTVDIEAPEGIRAVDTGFIVYNSATYPNLVALFEYLNVPTAASDMGFGVSLGSGAYEYAGGSLRQAIGNIGNVANVHHWRVLWDIIKFFRTAVVQIKELAENVTLGEFAVAHGYSEAFMQRHLLPMAGAIWSSSPRQMLNYPARSFLSFFDNHGLLTYDNRPQWRTVEGGAREYVERLVSDSRMRVLTNCPVKSIDRTANGVAILAGNGLSEKFDHVVVAAHADRALAMLAKPTDAEISTLSAFQYAGNRAVLHRDETLMPRRRKLWSSWNYISDLVNGNHPGAVTYWMNALQPLETKTNIFVTLNPQREPAANLVDREFSYRHPIFTNETARMQRQLWSLQGRQRTWFCGAYFGAGFHEDGLQSGLAVAEELGGILRPWKVEKPSSRIHVTPHFIRPVPTHLKAAE